MPPAVKDYPRDYSEDARHVLETMSLGPGLKINGSMSYRDQLYASDYDGFEIVKVKSVEDGVRRFQKMVQDVLKLTNVYIADIKCGEVPEWNLLKDVGLKGDKVVNYDATTLRGYAKGLFDAKVISAKDLKEAYKYLKPTMSPLDLLVAKNTLKYHIVRWTPSDVLKGYTTLRNGERYDLAQGITTPSMTKLDVIGYVQGNHYTDFSVIYQFVQGKKLLNATASSKDALIGAIVLDVKAFAQEGNYFKALKRIMSVARMENDKKLIEYLTPILNSDLGRLSAIVGDVKTLEDLLELYSKVPEDDVRFEIDQFIQRLSNVSLTSVVVAKGLTDKIRAMTKLPLSKLPAQLASFRVKLDGFLQSKARPIAEPLIAHLDKH